MSLIGHLKGEIEAIGTLIEQKTKEIEALTERKSGIEKRLKEEPKETPVEEKAEVIEEKVEAEEVGYASWSRDDLKAELEAREIKFANNAKTEKLIALLQESDQ